ncbi:MAG TPA: transporter substrate-binding domain-containing protein [Bacillales bacterium]|nr:transporter substrate-binding domain-containing protein [Bacillales bacterium]
MNKKRFLSIFLMVFLVAALAACGSSGGSGDGETAGSGGEGTSENSTDEGSNEGTTEGSGKTYVVATDNSFVPFEFVDKESGDIKGFDIDLMTAIAKEAGIDIKFKVMNFPGIIPGLKSGRWDMGIAGISITEKRDKSIDFSDPYYQSGLMVGVQADNTEIQGIDDLAGKTISTRQGSTSQSYIKKNLPKATAKAFPKVTQAYQELMRGSVDATLYDVPNLKYFIKTKAKGKIKTVGDVLEAQNYGIAFQEDSKLVDKVNKALSTLKENGTYADIYKEWFGTAPPK